MTEPEPVTLGAVVVTIVAGLRPADPPAEPQPRPDSADLVRAVLRAFPGAVIVDVRDGPRA